MISTNRLILRPWRDSDLPPFAEQNADPVAMRFLGGPLTRTESDAFVRRARNILMDHGFCIWAVEVPGIAPFIGAVGLTHVRFQAPFIPAIEVAWRLHPAHWGHGYATEAAQAAIKDGFTRAGLTEIVACTALINTPSRRVMRRLGMEPAREFDHPNIAAGNELRRHLLYRLTRGAAAFNPR